MRDLLACLTQVKAWSDAHQQHMPIAIQIQLEGSRRPPCSPPPPIFIGPDQLDDLDAEILSVFPTIDIITPDDVRGSHSTLEDAVLTDGWPKINDERGKVMFLLDNKRDEYVVGHPSLEGSRRVRAVGARAARRRVPQAERSARPQRTHQRHGGRGLHGAHPSRRQPVQGS